MRLRVCFLVCLLVVAFASGVTQAYGDERPEVRVIHASPDLGAVDVYLNDIFAGHLDFGLGGQFISVPQGAVILTALSEDGTELFSGELTAHNDQVMNAVVMGTSDNLTLNAYLVDRSPLEFGMSRVNVIHAIPNSEAIPVTAFGANGDILTLVDQIAFGANAQSELPSGAYALDFSLAVERQMLKVNSGISYTAVLVQTPDEEQRVVAQVFANAVTLDAPAGNLRLVQTLFELSPLDLYLNDTLVAAQLGYHDATLYMPLLPGDYEANFYLAATDPNTTEPVLETVITITENGWETGVLLGNVATPSLTFYSDDLSAVPEGQARVSVFNATTTDAILSSGSITLDATAGQLSDFQLIETGAQQITITVGDAVYEINVDISPDTPFNLRSIIITADGPIVLSACALP